MKEQYFPQFPDKKEFDLQYEDALRIVLQAQELYEQAEITQKEAIWIPEVEYPQLPLQFLVFSDAHTFSTRTDHVMMENHLRMVEQTPNTFLWGLGDYIDNFNAVVFPSGMYHDPLSPQIQGDAFLDRLSKIDKMGKLACLVIGNHDDWIGVGGGDFAKMFFRELDAPVLPGIGTVNVQCREGQKYTIAASHQYWGYSKLNPTNAARRLIETAVPEADVAMVGHTHFSDALQRKLGKKDRILLVGGTYVVSDPWAEKRGVFYESGDPGHVVQLWQDQRRMEVFYHAEDAYEDMMARVYCVENGYDYTWEPVTREKLMKSK